MSDDLMDEMFGEPISSYSAEQAVEDGVLVYPYPDKFKFLYLTRAVHDAIEAAIEGSERTYDQAAIPFIMDAAMVAQAKPDDYLWTDGLEGNVTGSKVWVQLNEKGGLTIMFPEDY